MPGVVEPCFRVPRFWGSGVRWFGGSVVPERQTCPAEDAVKLEVAGRVRTAQRPMAVGAGLFVPGEVAANSIGPMAPDHSTSNSQVGIILTVTNLGPISMTVTMPT